MEYNHYRARVEYDPDDRIFHGKILGLKDSVTFEGSNVDDLEKAFHRSVDEYLETCSQIGKKPERDYSGRIPLRTHPTTHQSTAIDAETIARHQSVNAWIGDELRHGQTTRLIERILLEEFPGCEVSVHDPERVGPTFRVEDLAKYVRYQLRVGRPTMEDVRPDGDAGIVKAVREAAVRMLKSPGEIVGLFG